MQYYKPWGSSLFLNVQGTITNADTDSLYYSELYFWKCKVNSEYFYIRWTLEDFFLPNRLGKNAYIFLFHHIVLFFFPTNYGGTTHLPSIMVGWKRQLTKSQEPFSDVLFPEGCILCKGWRCKVCLSRFHQVIFVLFQWPELVCCRWHSSWQKVGGVSKTLGFEGQELKLCIWALKYWIKSYPETHA